MKNKILFIVIFTITLIILIGSTIDILNRYYYRKYLSESQITPDMYNTKFTFPDDGPAHTSLVYSTQCPNKWSYKKIIATGQKLIDQANDASSEGWEVINFTENGAYLKKENAYYDGGNGTNFIIEETNQQYPIGDVK